MSRTNTLFSGDLNNLITSGFYRLESSGSVSHGPDGLGKGSYVMVLPHTTGYIIQELFFRDGSKVFIRGCSGGTWSDWKELSTASFLNSYSDLEGLASALGDFGTRNGSLVQVIASGQLTGYPFTSYGTVLQINAYYPFKVVIANNGSHIWIKEDDLNQWYRIDLTAVV